MDLSSGYHQLELDEESRDITTFATHEGLKRYKHLNFGTNPLRKLTKKDVKFEWTEPGQRSFDTLQAILSEKTTLSYLDSSKATKLTVDASLTGLATILIQHTLNKNDETVVAYGSRSLPEVKQRYSQIEREALAVVFGCEHFRLFLHGIHFMIHSP